MKQLAQSVSFGGYQVEGPEGFAFGSANIGTIVTQSLDYVLAFAGIGLLLMIISSGFSMMTSAGDPKKMESGKNRLTQAIIGFLLVIGAFTIVQLAGTMLGWDSIQNSFGQ